MMRRAQFLMSCFAAACLIASPVSAEDRKPPSPIFSFPFDWGAAGDPKAYGTLMNYAKCIVHVQRGQTSKFLKIDFKFGNRLGFVEDLVEGTGLCAADLIALRGDFDYFRGALIEALYDEDILGKLGKPLIVLGTSVPEKASFPSPLARCIVGRRPQESAALLRTKVASADQGRAFVLLKPDIDECAKQTKSTASSAELIRFQIAEELYRRASSGLAAAQ
jgi:hypothetical protein